MYKSKDSRIFFFSIKTYSARMDFICSRSDSKDTYNVTKDFYFNYSKCFWSFYSSKSPKKLKWKKNLSLQ